MIILSINIVRNIEKYEEFSNYEQDLLTTLLNLVRSFLRRNKLTDAHYFLQLAKATHKNPLFIYEKLLIDFFDYLLNLEEYQPENKLNAIKMIEFFKGIDLKHTADNLNVIFQERVNQLNV